MCRHNRIVTKDAAKVVCVGEDIFLQRQKNACRIHQIDGRNTVLNRDVLGADHFLRRHGEECPGFYRGIVGDNHYHASMNAS